MKLYIYENETVLHYIERRATMKFLIAAAGVSFKYILALMIVLFLSIDWDHLLF